MSVDITVFTRCFALLSFTSASAHRPLRRIRNKPSIIDHIAPSNEPFYGSVIQKKIPWRKHSLCQMVPHCVMLCHRSVGLLLSPTESTVRDIGHWFDTEAERRHATSTYFSFILGTANPRFQFVSTLLYI
ncbi:MAG: hypothetical protein BYD32DRAFT_248060 [Podila humilis]|nr:MAG: hypothetical protein BYD32DRAFT_248060 [Podila humilis]